MHLLFQKTLSVSNLAFVITLINLLHQPVSMSKFVLNISLLLILFITPAIANCQQLTKEELTRQSNNFKKKLKSLLIV